MLEEHSPKPIRGARIQARVIGAPRMTADLETDAEGKFRAEIDLPAGEYRVNITKPNYADATFGLRIPSRTPLEIRLTRFGSITGRITDGQNRPLRGATVLPMTAGTNGAFYPPTIGATAQTDDTGRYRIYNLPPGRYAVAVSWATMNTSSVSGTYLFPSNQRPEAFSIVSGTAIHGIDFVLPAQSEFSVSGRVELAGVGKRSAVTLVLREQPSLAAAMRQTEPDGSFSFDGIAPGSYELMTAGPAGGYAGFAVSLQPDPVFARTRVDVGGQPVGGIDVTPQAGRTIPFSLQSSVECPSSASILIEPLENWGALLYRTLDLHATGGLIVKDLAPGPYRIAVSKPADTCFGEERIVDMRTAESVRVAIAPGGIVEGRIAPVDGKMPVVRLLTASGVAQFALADADGRFRFPHLRPGLYRIRAGLLDQEITVRSSAVTQVRP